MRQTPQLDDSGNGVADQKNLDGLVAAQRYLGAAFATGADAPFIGAVVPDRTVVVGSPVTAVGRRTSSPTRASPTSGA